MKCHIIITAGTMKWYHSCEGNIYQTYVHIYHLTHKSHFSKIYTVVLKYVVGGKKKKQMPLSKYNVFIFVCVRNNTKEDYMNIPA